MLINEKNYYELNEEKAFKKLLSILSEECLDKFVDQMNLKSGWIDESNPDLHEILVDGLKKHVDRIEQGGYEEDDLIDIVNYIAMLYNIYEK